MGEDVIPENYVAPRPANLTYLRHRIREGIPENPGSWENFAAEAERACDELQEFREREILIYKWVKQQSTYDADVAGLQDFLEGNADTPDTPV